MAPDMSPVVSVLVTVFDREKYLGSALESILSSTYRDFEVIVVDDASSDGSLAVAKEIASRNDRVRVHSNSETLGDYGNRARAASLASGHYIKYVDSDDLIYPHSLAIMVESMEANPGAGLGLAHSQPEDEIPYPWRLSPEETYRKQFLGRGCLSCGPTGAIIRRDAFEAVGGFRPRWSVLSDIDLWLRLASRYTTVLLPPGLVWWRRHAEQEFTKDTAASVYLQDGYELAAEALSSPECPLPDVARNAALERNRQHFARRLLSLAFRRRQIAKALEMHRASNLSMRALARGLLPYQ